MSDAFEKHGAIRPPTWLVLIGTLAASACSDEAAPPDASDSGASIPEGDAHLSVEFGRTQGPVGRLIGWNLGRGTYYAPEGDAFHPEWRTSERIASIQHLRDVRAPDGPSPYVRFSGLQIDGSFGNDGYHFWDFVKPQRTVLSTDNLSVPGFASIADELGGELTVTVNFGSGTAEEAARYATYLNGTLPALSEVAARVASGKMDPYGVEIFEIGNEVYGFWNTGNTATGPYSYANSTAMNGGDPAWFGKPASSAADYAARALEYLRAVQAVAPGAKFRVPLTQASMDAWGGLDAALSGLSPLLMDPAVDAVVVHLYAADDGTTLGVTDVNDPEYAVAGSELFRPRFAELREKLDALDRTPPLGIAITEYNVADGFSHGTYRLGGTAALGLGLADLLVLFAQERIEHACQHLSLAFEETQDILVEDWYNPFRSDGAGGVVETPSFTITKLFASHLLSELATVTPGAMPTSTLTVAGESHEYARVNAVAFVDATGEQGTVFLVNRDLDDAARITLDIDGYTLDAAEQWAPFAVDADATEPIATTPATYRQSGPRVEITAPPHSVLALRASR